MSERKKSKLSIFAVMTICLVLLFSTMTPAATAQEEQPKYGGTLVLSQPFDFVADFNPLTVAYCGENALAMYIYSRLVYADDKASIHPDLAESWTVSEDALTVTFNLVKNATWHDGMPVTSADIKFTFDQYLKNPKLPKAPRLSSVESIETPDDYTVVFHFKKPDVSIFYTVFSETYVGAIIPKHIYEGTSLQNNTYNLKPIGCGPFIFKEWVKGDHLTLVRNPNYFKKGVPYVDSVVIRVMPETTSAIAALEKGELSMISGKDLTDEEIARLEKIPGIAVHYALPVYTSMCIHLQLRDPLLGNVKIRQALYYAVNMTEFVNVCMGDRGTPANGPIGPNSPYYVPPKEPFYPYSKEKAVQLLDEAAKELKQSGYQDLLYPTSEMAEHGGWRNPNHPLQLWLGSGFASLDAAAPMLKKYWEEVGLKTEIKLSDWTTIFTKLRNPPYDLMMAFSARPTYGPDPSLIKDQFVTAHASGSINCGNYSNPRLDELFDLQQRTTDFEKRKQIWAEIQEILREDVPHMILWWDRTAVVYREEWKSADPTFPYVTGSYHALLEQGYNAPMSLYWEKGSIISPESALSTIKEVNSTLLGMRDQGYDVKEALAKVNEAMAAYKAGNYALATELAEKARVLATAPWYIQYGGVIAAAVVLIIAASTVIVYRRHKHRKR